MEVSGTHFFGEEILGIRNAGMDDESAVLAEVAIVAIACDDGGIMIETASCDHGMVRFLLEWQREEIEGSRP